MISLQAGETAPEFSGVDQNGNTISLSQFKGEKVILYFYPKDDTPGCTKEACNLRDNYELLLKQGFVVLGVSADTKKAHQKFINKYELPFPLIADTDKSIIEAYGVWGEKNMYGRKYMSIFRTTFIIDESGNIVKIFKKVDTSNHTTQILHALGLE